MSPKLGAIPCAPSLTLIEYAAWRKRDRMVSQLLRAGANPTAQHRFPGGVLSAEEQRAVFEMLLSIKRAGQCPLPYVL